MSDAAVPRVSVIIPALDASRAASLQHLRAALEAQSLEGIEIVVVEGVTPQGKAINLGAARARAEILMVMDDDSAIADPTLVERLVETLDADPRIGMAGASVRTPEDAGRFRRRAAREFPRFNVPVVAEVTVRAVAKPLG